MLMQNLQARTDRIGGEMLRSQFKGQEMKRRTTIEAIDAGQRGRDAAADPADGIWEGSNDGGHVLRQAGTRDGI